MSRPLKFALGLAAFAIGMVVAPAVAALLLAGASSIVVATVAAGGSLLALGTGYALGTDDAAARLGASQVGPVLLWLPAVFAVTLVAVMELTPWEVERVLFACVAGVGVGFFGGAFAFGAAASEHARRTTAGRDAETTWEARPRTTWWRDERTLGGLAVVTIVAYLVLSVAIRPESTFPSLVLTIVIAGGMGLSVDKNRRRTFRAYEHGVAVESGKTTTFYEWDAIRGIERTADGLILRRRWGPLTDLDARAEDVADPDALVATLRDLRESRSQ